MRFIVPAFRILSVLAIAAVAAGRSLADDTPNPFLSSTRKIDEAPFDAFAEATRLEVESTVRANPRLTLVTEFIEIPQADWSRWSRDPEAATEGPEFRKRIGERMKSGDASLIDMNVVSGMSGDPLVSRYFHFHVYPSTFEPPRIDEKNGRIVPAAFATSECWAAGCAVAGSAVITSDGKVELRLSPEIVEPSGETITGSDEGEVRQPNFSIQKFDSVLVVNAGEPTLAGVMRSPKPKHPHSGEAVLLVFLRADIHVPAVAVKRPK